MHIQEIPIADPHYPQLLRNIPDPPERLFFWGNVERLHDDCLGIVGTRIPSSYGLAQTAHFSSKLAAAGLCIVSGLAYGIDAAAHRAAIETGQSIGVIAQGLKHLQPSRHKTLAQKIVEKGGLILSEREPDAKITKAYEYLKRNRIISGLSRAVLVMEAGRRSGAKNTASHAAEQGRDVLALPGRCTDPKSQGCHELIQKGAGLVLSPQQVLNELGISCVKSAPNLTPKEQALIKIIGSKSMIPAEMAESFSGSLMELYQCLHQLCQKSVLRCCPGQVYVLCSDP